MAPQQSSAVVYTETPALNLAAELKTRRDARIEKLKRSDPQHNPRASNIHDCARNIVYQVLDWDKKQPYDNWLIERFEQGRREERVVIEELRADGFDIIDQDVNGQLTIAVPEQTSPEFRKGEVLTGRIDGLIAWAGRWMPFEVKSVDPNKFKQIESLADFQDSPIFRRYLRQMQMYLLGRNEEQGLFILTDCLGHRLVLPVYLDYGEAGAILKKLEIAARAIKAREYPARIAYDPKVCGKCQFRQLCLPDIVNEGLELIDQDELLALVKERERLEGAASRYDEIDKAAKDIAKQAGKDFILNSAYKVEIKNTEVTRVDTKAMPIEVRTPYEKTTVFKRVNFIPLGELKA